MPIPWLTVLQTLPWSELIANAPKVADGAKKLWKRVGRQTPDADRPAAEGTLEERVAALERQLGEQHSQLLASSELIQTLAEQNAQLISLAETSRRRLRWMATAIILIALLAAFNFFAAPNH